MKDFGLRLRQASWLRFLAVSFLAVVWSLGLGSAAIAMEPAEVPPLADIGEQVWVIDLADALSTSTETELDRTLSALATETGKEVRLLTVQRIDFGQAAQDFAAAVFGDWFPTADQQRDRLLLLLATEDYRTALVAGENLQEVLPPATQASIAQETVLLPAQKAQFNRAALDGVARLEAILRGNPDPGPPVVFEAPEVDNTPPKPENPLNTGLIVLGVLVVATVVPMVTYYGTQPRD
ncbi:MAG: photosystem II repair protein Psb32 [Pseudanabaenaceae cyanobacterium]